MTDTSIGPGTVLAGRYRLDDLLQETSGAKFWRATDRILARSVAVNVLEDSDPRADALLLAARTSATVTDGHFLRVLDAAAEEGFVYVVNEWGSGVSLNQMLAEGPLPARRAAWLVKEVADAITTAHRNGVAHGRLLPENVMVTEAGSVKLIGFVVDSVLHGTEQVSTAEGEQLGGHESDVVNLASLLYATLVGRWPGSAGSELPEAPREHGRPMRPRQVRAGIPRPLDAICDRVLNTEAHEHNLPIETAHEIAAALSDFIGDPTGTAQVGYEPTTVISLADIGVTPSADADPDATQVVSRPTMGSAGETTAEATGQRAVEDSGEPTGEPVGEATGEPTGTLGRQPAEAEQTQAGAPLFFDDDTGVGWASPSATSGSNPDHTGGADRSGDAAPSFPESEARPLFAPDPPRTARTRRDPGTAHGSFAPRRTLGADPDTGTGPQPQLWPWGDDEDVEGPRDGDDLERQNAGKSWLRLAGILAVVLLLVIAVVVAFNLGRGSGGGPGTTQTSQSPSTNASPDQQPALVPITSVSDFDPQGDPPEENSDLAALATDGDPSTAWQTQTYFGNPELGGLKDGVGLLLDLGRPQEVSRVRLTLEGQPTDLEILAADRRAGAPSDADELTSVASAEDAGTNVDVQLRRPVTTRYLVVWLTSLPATEDGFQGQVAEINLRS